ncbi:BRCA1/BRCA2-containing complex subunit 3 [Acrasis kona]|uniref:BRCA1/BRCA2-containing complex subunit 3 n=1 Tax=Acrasis kona TaxID=1008807 RepID=A0AAW2Z571_9EUKA
MGLLLGNIQTCDVQDGSPNLIANIFDVCVLTRVDKRKDRVEISPDQLVHATNTAEKISEQKGVPIRVIGWYHSHPHFSPYPSHVDLRCQGNYQQLDQGFVGLIFSVFNTGESYQSNIHMHAFQSKPAPDVSNKLIDSPEILDESSDEDIDLYQSLSPVKSSPFMSVGIPIRVVSSSISTCSNDSLCCSISLQKILLQEERDTFQEAQSYLSSNQGHTAMLNRICNLTLYQRNLTTIIEFCSIPLLLSMREEYETNMYTLRELEDEEKKLLTQLQ